MNFYELTCLLPSDLSEEEAKKISEKIISFIQEKDGILKEELFKNKFVKEKLGQSTKKEIGVYLNTITFYLSPQRIEELKIRLKAEDRIVRYMILVKKPSRETKISKALPQVEKTRREIATSPKKVDLKEIEKKLEEILE